MSGGMSTDAARRPAGLPPGAVEQLVERTEGWAAGLRLTMGALMRPQTVST